MAHVTFIHGIANKPAAGPLLALWRHSLTGGDEPLDLGAEGVSSSMVYWADVLYPGPDAALAAPESVERIELEAVIRDPRLEDVRIEPRSPHEKRWLDSLASRFGVTTLSLTLDADYTPPEPEADGSFERVPLPWAVKRRFLKAFLRDVHHYLFNAEYSPRQGETYQVQTEIRRRFVEALDMGAADGPPHVVVSHSLGTVIAYDCLKRVSACLRIDALITLGSPLGLDEIQDRLQPGWTRPEGFPGDKVGGDWVNVFDHLDPVAAFDPFLSSDFRQKGREVVLDIHEPNYGAWRHDVSKYLAGRRLRTELRRLLAL